MRPADMIEELRDFVMRLEDQADTATMIANATDNAFERAELSAKAVAIHNTAMSLSAIADRWCDEV